MSRMILNVFLLLILAVIVWLNVLKGRDLTEPNVEFLPEMVHSVPVDAYSASTVFPDGKTLQRSVIGTIARGRMPLHYEATPEDAIRAGLELTNPYASDDNDALQRGAKVYAIYCQHCHGARGHGDGAVVAHGFPPPPSLHTDSSKALAGGHLFHIITYGQGNMPAHGPLVSPEDRWKAIIHIRDLQAKIAQKQSADSSSAVQP